MAQDKLCRETILSNGWEQGSIVPYSEIDTNNHILGTSICLKKLTSSILLIISQDCDVAQVGGDEPYVECIILRKVRKNEPHSGLLNGNNPRKLQVCTDEGEWWECKAKESLFLCKQYLNSNAYKGEVKLTIECINIIKQWKANRYTRLGMPEKFADLTRDVMTGFSQSALLVEHIDKIHSIRVHCQNFEDGFQCSFILLHKFSISIEEASVLEELFNTDLLIPLEEIPNITLLNTSDENEDNIFQNLKMDDVMSEMDFGLGMVHLFPRYYFDSISFEKGDDVNKLAEN